MLKRAIIKEDAASAIRLSILKGRTDLGFPKCGDKCKYRSCCQRGAEQRHPTCDVK